MNRYEEYKDTGIAWLPRIPAHWEERKFKYCFVERSEKNHPDEEMLCATQSHGVIPQSMYQNRVVVVNKGFEGLKLVNVGDFVISLRSFEGGIEYAYYQGIISAAYTILTPVEKQCTEYFKRLFKSQPFIQLLQTCVTGIREGQNINYPLLGRKQIPIPPLTEQEKIVRFLEDKTSKIDALLEEKGEQIELLNELKESEIANIITRGLNPDVKMKDSGIPWIGMIPEHWEIKKISSLFKERREKVSDKVFQALSVSKQGITLQLETAVKTDNGDNRKKVCVGDFVVNSRSDRKGSCGISPFDGSVSLINIVLQPRNFIEGKFFHYLFRSNNYIEEYYRLGRGIVADLWTTRYSEMKNILVPLPPLEEQRAIVKCIEDKCNKVNSLISELEAEIEYLKEYKQKLIADCVTGQIDVRNM